jgi:cysteine rich repeat protein
MVVRRITRWSLVITVLFAGSAAVAQTDSPAPGAGGRGKFRAACAQDVQRFCVGVQPGGGRLVQCLSSHTREVSAACGNMIAAIHARRDNPDPSAQSPVTQSATPVTGGNPPAAMGIILRASCGPDAQRLCEGARRESDVLKCLDSQRMKLSTTCSSYFQKLGTRPAAQKNTPNKKPPSPPPAKPPAKPPGNETEPGPG